MPPQVQENKKTDNELNKNPSKELEKIVLAAKELYSKVDKDKDGNIALGELKDVVMPVVTAFQSGERRDFLEYRLKDQDRAYISQNRIDLNIPNMSPADFAAQEKFKDSLKSLTPEQTKERNSQMEKLNSEIKNLVEEVSKKYRVDSQKSERK